LAGVITSHVVNDGVYVDSDSGGIAPANHVGELCSVSRAAIQPIAHRLVSFPPWSKGIGHNSVFVGWRHLDSAEPVWAQKPLALGSDIDPFPLKQVHHDLSVTSIGAVWGKLPVKRRHLQTNEK